MGDLMVQAKAGDTVAESTGLSDEALVSRCACEMARRTLGIHWRVDSVTMECDRRRAK